MKGMLVKFNVQAFSQNARELYNVVTVNMNDVTAQKSVCMDGFEFFKTQNTEKHRHPACCIRYRDIM